ncbi:hypothetical protein [Streptomyces canus]|uniref:hypothetical protein n=1 Tax=Streptomyces canus TaxID=58343 RepID=UPI00035EF952|nr:hypothetical protein [Streptomyces canus]
MTAPPQRRGNGARRAERDAKIFALKIAGVPEREIGREVGLSQSRVNTIIAQEIARRIGPVAEEYANQREAELVGLWRISYRDAVNATTVADRLKAVETCRRINESRRRLRGADAPEAMEVTLTKQLDLASEAAVGAVKAALDAIALPPDRAQHAISAAVGFLEAAGAGEPFVAPETMSSGSTAAPYIDNGAMFIDGPGGLRYRIASVENQPGEAVDRAALPPARTAEDEAPADAIIEELDLIETEYAEILEEAEDDGPEGDQEAAS